MAEIVADKTGDGLRALALTLPDATGKAIADALGVSAPWLRTLEKQGFAERKENGLFDVVETMLGYARWLKDPARSTHKTEGAKALDVEKLRRMKIETAKALAELIDWDLVEAFFEQSHAALIATFSSIFDGVTDDLELQAKLTQQLHRGFDKYRMNFDAMAAAARASRDTYAEQVDDEDEP